MKCFYPFKDKFKPFFENHKFKLHKEEVKKPKGESSALSVPRTVPEMYKEKEQNLRVFTLPELREATNRFSRLLKIGEGGFGSVYKGKVIPQNGNGDPIEVAIKKLNRQGLQGHKQWLAEVQFLGIVEHQNLVKLLGYCATEEDRGILLLLVYEYMPNKSLDDHLFNRAYETLSWKTRLEVILGAARGLAYLHEGLEVQVIYRDFKSSNVLLDEDFKAKLSDFGLAREGPIGDHTHVSTAVVGTYGYAAPDYVGTGHLTTKSDVYSFGVVLYEILTGRRALERSRPTSEQKLLEWVKQYPIESKKFLMMIDPQMGDNYPVRVVREIAKLANNCLLKNPKDRPTMSQVVETLEQALKDSVQGNYMENGNGRQ